MVISGDASDGVSQDLLNDQAQSIARKRGADVLINASAQVAQYNGTYVVPGHVTYRPIDYYGDMYVARYHPTRYIPYQNTILRFQGELAVFSAAPAST